MLEPSEQAVNETTSKREEIRLASLEWRKQASDALFAHGYHHQSDELRFCSDPRTMSSLIVCSEDEKHFSKAVVKSCHLRYCPICAHARAAELVRDYEPVVLDALASTPESHTLKHITLTTPYPLTDPDMRNLYRKIWKAVVVCLENTFGVKVRYWKEAGLGFVGGAEFGESGNKLHVHLAGLCPWIDLEKLSESWSLATGGDCRIVWVRAIDDAAAGLSEVLKYATKMTELPPRLVPVLHAILAGTRRIRAFGMFAWKISKKQHSEAVCPICGAPLKEHFLLNLKLGNNFATGDEGLNPENPVVKAIPPPEPIQIPLIVVEERPYLKYIL